MIIIFIIKHFVVAVIFVIINRADCLKFIISGKSKLANPLYGFAEIYAFQPALLCGGIECIIVNLRHSVGCPDFCDIPAVFPPWLVGSTAHGDVLREGEYAVRCKRPAVTLDGERNVAHTVHLAPFAAVGIVGGILAARIVEIDFA